MSTRGGEDFCGTTYLSYLLRRFLQGSGVALKQGENGFLAPLAIEVLGFPRSLLGY
jgi:hypothetical protein